MILILYYTLHFIEVKFISNIMVCLQNRLLFGKIGTVNICSYVGCGSRIFSVHWLCWLNSFVWNVSYVAFHTCFHRFEINFGFFGVEC